MTVERKVRLHWKDQDGLLKSTMAKAKDVSSRGLRVELDRAIALETLVNLECRELKVAGVAVVRHCRRSSVNHYTVGLEFAGGLEWRGSASPT